MFMDISRSLPLSHSPLVVDEHAAALKPVCCWSAFVFVCRNLVIGGDAKPSTAARSHIWWPWVFDVATSFLVTSCSALLHVMILGVRRVSLLPLPLQNRWEMQQVITMCCLALLPISFTTVCMSPFSTYIDSSSLPNYCPLLTMPPMVLLCPRERNCSVARLLLAASFRISLLLSHSTAVFLQILSCYGSFPRRWFASAHVSGIPQRPSRVFRCDLYGRCFLIKES